MAAEARASREHGYVNSIFGRRIHLPDIRAKGMGQRQAAERAANDAHIQGAAADLIRRAMARTLLQVHDELVFEAPEAEAQAVKALAVRVMSDAAEPAVALSAPLDVDARAARNWDEAHRRRPAAAGRPNDGPYGAATPCILGRRPGPPGRDRRKAM